MTTSRRRFALSRWIAVTSMALMVLGGCGRKAPPVPPKRPPLPAVVDLTADLQDRTVTLRWHHPANGQGVAGYVVLRAQSALSQPACPDCPLIFQKIQNVTVERAGDRLEFSQTLPIGFRYTFKVQPYGSSGAPGPDSNLVVVKTPP